MILNNQNLAVPALKCDNMQAERENTRALLRSVILLKERHVWLADTLVRLEGQKAYDEASQYFDSVIAKLTKEVKSLPVGFRYTGTFYVRKPYTMPTDYRKVDGSAYMREELLSWTVETEEDLRCSYLRAIYKAPNDESELKREDAEPVYEEERVG